MKFIRGFYYWAAGFYITAGCMFIVKDPWYEYGRWAGLIFYLASTVMFTLALHFIKKIFTESEQREKS